MRPVLPDLGVFASSLGNERDVSFGSHEPDIAPCSAARLLSPKVGTYAQ